MVLHNQGAEKGGFFETWVSYGKFWLHVFVGELVEPLG